MIEGELGRASSRPGAAPPQAKRRVFADLLPRVVSGIVLIVLALATVFEGGLGFALLWWAASLAILWEWQRLLGPDRLRARLLGGAVAISIAVPLVLQARFLPALLVVLAGTLGAAALAVAGRRALAAGGVLYAASLPVAVVLLRNSFPYGLPAILWLFAVVWGTDIFAYFGGRLIGGPKLWPRMSPSKTWAGFLVGVGAGAILGFAVAPAPPAIGPTLVLGLMAGAVSQGGDLFESSLKRRFGVKDSSRLIPGHGGVMDRLDGFLAAAVFAALVGVARFGMEMPATGLFRW